MTQKNMSYDHAAYIARQAYAFGQNAAGASTNFGKFVAFTSLVLFAVQATLITAGTSTATAFNGTATTTSINGDSFSVVHVFANGAAGTGAVSTATHGPFNVSGYNGTATGTQTATSGNTVRVQLSGAGVTGNVQAGTNTADGGVVVNPGDTINILRGADATAVSAFAIEYAIQQLANVSN
jgi:hypothetical protein